jgi:fructosamine-3-kinase
MFDTNQAQLFERILFESTGQSLALSSFEMIAGGCISQAVKLQTAAGIFFVKFNESAEESLFQIEAQGLELLRRAQALPVPQVFGWGRIEGNNYLLLEYIADVYPKPSYWQALGEGLAALHRHSQPSFGLDHNNFIGALPQNNEARSKGVDFWIEKRLKVQAGLAYYQGKMPPSYLRLFEKLYERLPALLPEEPPALLHGDLWSGNVLTGADGLPVLIDPAVYYGLREAELAFTQLFGGFDDDFYEAYQAAYPLLPNFEERVPLYQLYPLLVHLNLFEGSYLSAIERTLRRFAG